MKICDPAQQSCKAYLVLYISKKTTISAFKWHLIHLHLTSGSNFMAILGCGKRKLWLWENSLQCCQFGIISVRKTQQKANFNNFIGFQIDRIFWTMIEKVTNISFLGNLKMTWVIVFCTILSLLRILLVRLYSPSVIRVTYVKRPHFNCPINMAECGLEARINPYIFCCKLPFGKVSDISYENLGSRLG